METLKELEQITQPDSRRLAFVVINRQTGETRPPTIDDVYQSTAEIKLHEGVPEDVRDHFATAQNLLLYSWFYFPFNVTAQFMAFVTLEFALRKKLKVTKETCFKELVLRAVKTGWVKDEGFSHIRSKRNETLEWARSYMQEPVKSYCETLVDVIPYLRNELAHGSSMLYPSGASSVRICAEFVNQLYSENLIT